MSILGYAYPTPQKIAKNYEVNIMETGIAGTEPEPELKVCQSNKKIQAQLLSTL